MLWSASCGMYHAVWMQLFSKTILKMACFWLNTWYSNFCAIFKENTGNNMKCPKKHVEDDFVMWWHFYFILKCPKIEEFHFRFLFWLRNWGISEKHVINFKTEKEPKMKFFDLGAFQNKMQMQSHDKIIFHVLFGAFHITSQKDVNATGYEYI